MAGVTTRFLGKRVYMQAATDGFVVCRIIALVEEAGTWMYEVQFDGQQEFSYIPVDAVCEIMLCSEEDGSRNSRVKVVPLKSPP